MLIFQSEITNANVYRTIQYVKEFKDHQNPSLQMAWVITWVLICGFAFLSLTIPNISSASIGFL